MLPLRHHPHWNHRPFVLSVLFGWNTFLSDNPCFLFDYLLPLLKSVFLSDTFPDLPTWNSTSLSLSSPSLRLFPLVVRVLFGTTRDGIPLLLVSLPALKFKLHKDLGSLTLLLLQCRHLEQDPTQSGHLQHTCAGQIKIRVLKDFLLFYLSIYLFIWWL